MVQVHPTHKEPKPKALNKGASAEKVLLRWAKWSSLLNTNPRTSQVGGGMEDRQLESIADLDSV